MLHSEIAIAHSGYFRRQYAKEMKTQTKAVTLNITHLTNYDANAVRRVVNFFYTGILPCSLAEIPELLALCCKLQVINKLHERLDIFISIQVDNSIITTCDLKFE